MPLKFDNDGSRPGDGEMRYKFPTRAKSIGADSQLNSQHPQFFPVPLSPANSSIKSPTLSPE